MDGQLIAFTGIAAGLVAMPGADFTVVVRNALVSRRAGAVCGLGIAAGLLVHTTLAVAGVAAVLVAVPALFRALQLLGGAYVLQLGLRTLWSVRRPAAAP
ncbi:LysE family transporter, partial [Streptomyces sp. NPDC020362]|uniref:LysE family transporter n=1 Tax=Streptomyces sp. NPDC020362 TaxID=3154486 RepID=UPI0033BFDEED